MIRLLRDTARTGLDARASVSRFLDGVVFSTVIAAPDAHARNDAVLLQQDRVHLAPLFDVATSLAHAREDRVLSMSVGGEHAVDRVGAAQWTSLADSAGLDPVDLLGRVEVAAAVLPAVSAALDEVDDGDGSVRAVRERLLPALRQRVRRVEELLAAPR
ncbi:HipA-like protein [Luteimicrobium subarcticum]|uniref:HipA-like protein n=1 Tax=Luteimicrobium subarcticum TaxID=620910 RepID=A0A2M8WUG1_9MICO|nr:HipA-like protein [Luteimicrobium subarcticum]